jgi:hypothetical protein
MNLIHVLGNKIAFASSCILAGKWRDFQISIRSEFAMSSFVKASLLGLGLLAGAAFAAQAQTNTASLPPGGGNVPSAVAPSGEYPGPNPGSNSISGTPVMGGPVVASDRYPGPDAGAGTGKMPPLFQKPAGYDADRNMTPYGAGYGPKLN